MRIDNAVPARELDALRIGLRIEGVSLAETRDSLRALDAHVGRLGTPFDGSRTVILPTYNGTRWHPNLTALLALLVVRFGVPVLLHGASGSGDAAASRDGAEADPPIGSTAPRKGRVTTVEVLRELGIEPAASMADATARLARTRIAFVPLAILAPRLATLLSRHSSPNERSSMHSLAKLIDPFSGAGYRVVSVEHADDPGRMRELLAETKADAMLLRGTEGEPFADPRRQPQLEDFDRGVRTVCAALDCGDAAPEPELPATNDAPATATWIAKALAGEVPVPSPIVAQLACCLIGARRPVPID